MAFGIVHRFSGGNEDQYRATLAAVHPNNGADLPDGQILHVAGATDDGWIIVAVHQSKEGWENFRDNTLGPTLQAGVDGGFAGPPQEIEFEVRNQQTA